MGRRIPWIVVLIVTLGARVSSAGAPPDTTYVFGEASQDGTGKYYMGREIARVMGHRGADWLERPERARDEAPEALVKMLELDSADVVADIGAGTGYFTFRLSPLVPEGKVLAVDIQKEMLDIISERAAREGVDNVVPVMGAVDDPHLPELGVDVALMVDAYHEFSYPREMMQGVYESLRPGGRVVVVEYRLEDPDVPIKRLHKMSRAQARAEMAAVGLEWVKTKEDLPRQHFMVFRKPVE